MRHRNQGRKLNRNSSHRRAMFRNMMNSLFAHETIRTTLPKAKELRRMAEPIITKAAEDTVANRRFLFSLLRDKDAVGKLFVELGPRYEERPGGYIRILKDGFRNGDKAPMSLVVLMDQPERVDTPHYARESRKENRINSKDKSTDKTKEKVNKKIEAKSKAKDKAKDKAADVTKKKDK